MGYLFRTCDVFTDRVFGGNPLAVLPDARGLSTRQMQLIAREFNLSETVFMLPPETEEGTRRLRIFTPAVELPFAGHPTLGAAHVLAWSSRLRPHARAGASDKDLTMTFEEGIGPVPVTLRTLAPGSLFAELSAKAPEVGPDPPAARSVAAALSLEVGDLVDGGHAMAAVSCGSPKLIVPVTGLDAVRRARLNRRIWEQDVRDSWAPHLYVFTCETEHPDTDVHARFFAPAMGIEEDPATGAGAASLAGYLAMRDSLPTGHLRWWVEQGIELGRPSRIAIAAEKHQGAVTSVRVGGCAVPVGGGTLDLPGAEWGFAAARLH